MSATIITEFSRDAYNPATLFRNGVDGDVLRRDAAGQLWERVAERDREVSDTYASERFLNAWYRSRVGGSDLARVSGYRYVKAVYTETLRSGIIRAGERVK